MKELTESTHNLSDYRLRFEATRSFELEDDVDFIPNLLTDSDVSLSRMKPAVARRVRIVSSSD
jgi:hypothetical protein